MDEEETEQEAIALVDEFSANTINKSVLLAAEHPVDELVIRAVATYGLARLKEKGDSATFSLVFSQAVALGAFLQYKGRFDIMKLRGTIQ